MRNTSPEEALGSPAVVENVDHGERKAITIIGAAVGEPPLGQGPDVLVGVEFGGVGREVLEAEAGNATRQLLHRREAMQPQAIPEHDHRAPQVAQQMSEEGADLDQADVVMVPLVVEAEALADRADREPGDDGDAIVAIPMAQQRGLAPGRPGPEDGRGQHEARFVYEDEVGPQPNGVFFTRGHTLRFQRVMAASFRSRARRSGFW